MFAAHYAELVNYFARSLNDRDAAADVVQESYARVIGMHGRAVVHDLRALLYRIGRNVVIDDARRRRTEAGMLETLALLQRDEFPSAEREADVRQQLDRLAARLTVMPRKRCEAFVLVRIYGFSHVEAAAHQGCSEAAIEKHVVRAVCDLLGFSAAMRD